MKSAIYLAFASVLLFTAPPFVSGQQNNEVDPTAIRVPDAYAVEVAVTGLSVPTTAIFNGEDLIVAESGFGDTAKPRVLRITPSGDVTLLVSEGLIPPVTGLLVVNGALYISHKGKVSRLNNGTLTDIVTGLPSEGDHQNNNIVLGRDGRIYLGQGTVTNSAIVGDDNYVFGWLDKNPQAHDIPCADITLTGKNYTTDNPLTEDKNDKATTGAYKAFGTPSQRGEVIPGNPKCNGAILSFLPDGSDLKVVSWGLRNPFGLDIDKNGQIWSTFHGADVRGSRGIFNDVDYLVKVEEGAWYGWPDYYNGKPVTDPAFDAPASEQPTFLMQDHPKLNLPFITLDSHSGANGLAFSPGGSFWFDESAFIASFGTFTPVTSGPNVELSGFNILMVNMSTGAVNTFAENKVPGPAYINRQGGFNRPSDVLFGPDNSMYVVDWGGLVLTERGLENQEQTGVIWRIYNTQTQQPIYANNRIVIPVDPIPDKDRDPLVRNVAESYQQVFARLWPIGLILIILVAGIVWYRRIMR